MTTQKPEETPSCAARASMSVAKRRANTKTRKFWKIEGYDGTSLMFKTELPLSAMSTKKMLSLLQRLACMHLNEKEIIASTLSPKSKKYVRLLEPLINQNNPNSISVGENPYFIATVWPREELG